MSVSAINTSSNYLTNTALCSACSASCRHVQTHNSLRKRSWNCLFLANKTILSTPRFHAFLIRAGQSLWTGWGHRAAPGKDTCIPFLRDSLFAAWALTSSSIGAEFLGVKGWGGGLFWFYNRVIFNLLFFISSAARMAISNEQIHTHWGLRDLVFGVFLWKMLTLSHQTWIWRKICVCNIIRCRSEV